MLSAVPQALRHFHRFDAEKLRRSGKPAHHRKTFFGDWYDPDSGNLLRLGRYKTATGGS